MSDAEEASDSAPPAKKKRSAKERFGNKVNPFAPKTVHAVGRTPEFRRIATLARRDEWEDASAALTEVFALPALPPNTCPPKCPCRGTGSMSFRPRQAWALKEFFEQRGGIGILGVGVGKTLITLILPLLMGWKRAVLFVPAALRNKTLKIDIPLLSRHWKLPPIHGMSSGVAAQKLFDAIHGGGSDIANGFGALEIRSYEELSLAKFADWLEMQKIPDGIIADEVHNLKNRSAARTKRLLRFFSRYPDTEFVGMSGSLVHRSVMDYGHLMHLGLKDTSPLPHGFLELKTWADALDDGVPEFARPHPGAMMDLCRTGETVRDGYRRRVLETPGIVSSPDLSTNIGLQIMELNGPPVPDEVKNAFQLLRNFAELPGGEVATSALDQARHARELFLGFYLKWLWPDGVRDLEWLKARRAWRKYVRKKTTHSQGGVWYDTELQVANAVARGDLICSEIEYGPDGKKVLRTNVDVYREWVEIRDDRKKKWNGQLEPPKKAEWISDYMIEFIEKWAREHKGDESGIVWVENREFLKRLRERGAAPCYGAGENEIEHESGKHSVFASYAHTVGKNLPMWHRMWFPNPLESGDASEQAIGREHRPGQNQDDVIVEVTLGCRETWWSFEKSKMDARYIEDTMGQPQRLNKATFVLNTTEEIALGRCEAGDPLWAETGHAKIDGMFGKIIGHDKDGKPIRAATNTPTLAMMKKAAKTGDLSELAEAAKAEEN